MKKVKLKINNIDTVAYEGQTILEASKKIGIDIPTLCYMNMHSHGVINQHANCRVCMVEIENKHTLEPSCATKVQEGMVVRTDSLKALSARRTAIELLLSNHPADCLICPRSLDCELQKLAQDLGVREIHYQGEKMRFEIDNSSASIVKNPNKCVMCRRCETMCNEVQTCGILSALGRGFDSIVATAFNIDMVASSCTYCGQCVAVCPTAALTEVDSSSKVIAALNNPNKHVIVQVAPAVRVAIGEMFGLEPGTISTGQLVTSLRRFGFDAVFDTNFAADLTIMEEAAEFVDRYKNGGTLPILTSCCPAWVKFFEHQFPDLLDIPSTCKSPHIMLGVAAKTYYAEQMNIDPDSIVVVSVMPCLAKKAESVRPELSKDHNQNVDLVITTREYGKMCKAAGVDFVNLPEDDFDSIIGESSGAGDIFGSTGGVIEATLRTAYELITGEELQKVDFKQLRGMEDIRSATVNIQGTDFNIGIAHGLGSARELLEEIKSGKTKYHAIEIMACYGGCIGGGGQPYHLGDLDVIKKRQKAIYKIDKGKKIRKSHENPMIKKIYADFLGEPLSHKAHELLHTKYEPKDRI